MQKEIRRIRAEKAVLARQLEKYEAKLAAELDELAELGDAEPPSVPGMTKQQVLDALGCMVGAKNVQIKAFTEVIKQLRFKMAGLVIQESRVRC